MKRAATIVFAAVVGIHCGQGVDADALGADELVSIVRDSDDPRPPQRAAPSPPPAVEEEPSDSPRSFAPMLLTHRTGVVSEAAGKNGVTYVAGLFSGRLEAGGTTLESRGEDDVFLARIDANGSIAWARAVGSTKAESKPEVTFQDGQVKLVAFTAGEVDCGRGPLGNTWSSPMFFLCVFSSADGELLHGGIFPTGSP